MKHKSWTCSGACLGKEVFKTGSPGSGSALSYRAVQKPERAVSAQWLRGKKPLRVKAVSSGVNSGSSGLLASVPPPAVIFNFTSLDAAWFEVFAWAGIHQPSPSPEPPISGLLYSGCGSAPITMALTCPPTARRTTRPASVGAAHPFFHCRPWTLPSAWPLPKASHSPPPGCPGLPPLFKPSPLEVPPQPPHRLLDGASEERSCHVNFPLFFFMLKTDPSP